MDFKKIKDKLTEATKKAWELANEKLESTWKSIINSKASIKDKEWLDLLIEKSKNKEFTSKETWEHKVFVKRSILIIAKEESDFFKSLTYEYPILVTKTFSQNIYLKLSKEKIDWYDYKDLWVEEIPSIVVFENAKKLKIISWKENIQKLVKSIKLDINKEIDLI